MKVRINFTTGDDYMFEKVTAYVSDKEVTYISTAADCPEDNNCSRLGIAISFAQLAKALGAEVEHTEEPEEE